MLLTIIRVISFLLLAMYSIPKECTVYDYGGHSLSIYGFSDKFY